MPLMPGQQEQAAEEELVIYRQSLQREGQRRFLEEKTNWSRNFRVESEKTIRTWTFYRDSGLKDDLRRRLALATLGELAKLVKENVVGESKQEITGISGLEDAKPGEIL